MFFRFFNKDDIVFRGAVGAVTYRDGKFLVFERKHNPGSFQFSQGGRNKGEPVEESMWRELVEETGITSDDTASMIQLPYLLSYEYDTDRKLPWAGQTFTWFYIELKPGVEPNLATVKDKEFVAYKWMNKEEILGQLVGFRKEIYQTLFSYFDEK